MPSSKDLDSDLVERSVDKKLPTHKLEHRVHQISPSAESTQ